MSEAGPLFSVPNDSNPCEVVVAGMRTPFDEYDAAPELT